MDALRIVENIQRVCKMRGTTPTVACRESGAGRTMVSDMKKKGTIPSIEKFSLLAAYLGVTTSELLGEEKTAPPEVESGEADLELWELLKRIPPERMPEVERYLRFQADDEEKP